MDIRPTLVIVSKLLILFLLMSCAHPPELQKYPNRQIDRPYTLPEGLNTWKILFTGYQDNSSSNRSFHFGGIFPLNWEQSINDNLTLVWSPLPFQIRYQLYRDSSSYWGIYFNWLGPIFTRGQDFNWSPTLHLTYRNKVSSFTALEGTLVIEPEFIRDRPWDSSTLGVEATVWIQPWENWSLGAKQGFLWERGAPRSRYFGGLPRPRTESNRPLFPFTLKMQGMLSQRWQLETEYQFLSIPSVGNYIAHQILLQVSYFW